MKTTIKALAVALAVSTLAGCAVTPPTPAFQLTDADLCAEMGYAYTTGNTNRVAEVAAEGNRRHAAGTMTIDQGTCEALAQTGANRVAQEQAAAAQQQAAWAAVGQYGQQLQQQAAQQDALAQQQMQQSMQQANQMQQNMLMQQQTQALQGINQSLRGY